MDSDGLYTTATVLQQPSRIGVPILVVMYAHTNAQVISLPIRTHNILLYPISWQEPFVSVYYTYYIYSAKPRPTAVQIYFLRSFPQHDIYIYIYMSHPQPLETFCRILDVYIIIIIITIISADRRGEVSTTFLEILYNVVSHIYFRWQTKTFSLELNIRTQDKHVRVHAELFFD